MLHTGLVGVMELDTDLEAAVRAARSVVALTGAGMSAESGLPTFRGGDNGLWSRFDPTLLATPDAWATDPELVWGWYAWRIGLARAAQPHAGHRALVDWGRHAEVVVVTQNVDDLHERAGSDVRAHLHGRLLDLRCGACGAAYGEDVEVPGDPLERLAPPRCDGCGGAVRPGVVWFGEALPEGAFDAALDAVRAADLVLVCGTSGLVHPAAALPDIAAGAGAVVVEVNPEVSAVSDSAHHHVRAGAAVGLPALRAAAVG